MTRRILGVLLAAMAVGQVSDPGGFVDVVETYQLGGRSTAWLVAAVLISGEAVGAVGLLRGSAIWQRRGATVAVVVAAAWTALAVQAFARGLALENCGCFGVHLAQSLRWWVLVQDVGFVALAAWVRWRTLRARSAPTGARGLRATNPTGPGAKGR